MIPSRVLGSLIGAYAVAIVLLAPAVTHADSVDQPPTKTVRFDDLNLATSYGAETLFRRIQIAATAVCEEFEPQGNSLPTTVHESCIRNAVAGAVRNVDSPLLTAYYQERQNRHSQITASR